MFEAIHSRLERISQYAVWVGGAALLAAAVMVTLDVFARKFFSITMSGSDEHSAAARFPVTRCSGKLV